MAKYRASICPLRRRWVPLGCTSTIATNQPICVFFPTVRQLQSRSNGRVFAVPPDAVLFDVLPAQRLERPSGGVRPRSERGRPADYAAGRRSVAAARQAIATAQSTAGYRSCGETESVGTNVDAHTEFATNVIEWETGQNL